MILPIPPAVLPLPAARNRSERDHLEVNDGW